MRTKAGLYVDASETHAMLTRPEGRKVVLIDVRDPVEVKFTGSTRSALAADCLCSLYCSWSVWPYSLLPCTASSVTGPEPDLGRL